MSKGKEREELTDEEIIELNRWSKDSGRLSVAAAEAVLAIVGIHKNAIDPLYFHSLINRMLIPTGGSELGSIGPSSIKEGAIPSKYKRVAHPEYTIYVEQVSQPARQRGSVINDPGFYRVIVRSNDTTWLHQFMAFGFWPHTKELYLERIESHKRLIAMRAQRE